MLAWAREEIASWVSKLPCDLETSSYSLRAIACTLPRMGGSGQGIVVEVIGAFTSSSVARLARITKRQVEYWDRSGVYSPTLAKGRARQPYGRIYSFRDVVAIRTLAVLREKVSLQQLRAVGEHLRRRYDEPWATLEFAVDYGEVFWRDPDSGQWLTSRPLDQSVMPYRIAEITADVESQLASLKVRSRTQWGKVTRNRFVANNQYVIAGTRIPTEIIWQFHNSGYSNELILCEYPDLTMEDVRKAIEFESARLAS